jgi:hypothetical protein
MMGGDFSSTFQHSAVLFSEGIVSFSHNKSAAAAKQGWTELQVVLKNNCTDALAMAMYSLQIVDNGPTYRWGGDYKGLEKLKNNSLTQVGGM